MRALGWLTALLLVAGTAWVLVDRGPLGRRADVAVGYAARVVCACRYLGGRSEASCRTDFEPGMERVALHEDAAARRITATITPIARASARYDAGYGCVLD